MFDWLSGLDEKVLAALIGGVAGLVVTLLNHLLGPLSARTTEKFRVSLLQDAERERTKLQQQLTEHAESLKNRHQRELDVHRQALTDRSGVASARRDYEYEARKRLYTEVEPLLFQLHESLEEAHYRVKSLARTSRKGSLGVGRDNWLRGDGYYLRSTLYKLMLPAVHFRLMQRRVTFVDLNLDDSIGLRYKLMKMYVRSFTDDFVFAELQPALDYNPNAGDRASPRQALVLGDLENVADLMIVGTGEEARAMLFGEFEALLDAAPLNGSLEELVMMLKGFSAMSRPVLTRLLVTQACLAHVILSVYHSVATVDDLVQRLHAFAMSADAANQLSWTGSPDHPQELLVALEYGSERLRWLSSTNLA